VIVECVKIELGKNGVRRNHMTENTLKLFKSLWDDRYNWNDEPLYGGGQVDNGNLLDLKKKGYITTFMDEGAVFVQFTSEGRAYATEEFGGSAWRR
jgi:hypothetical protein